MRIEHLTVYLVLVTGVLAVDDENLEERTAHFVKTRLVPALKLAEVVQVDFDRVHLCLCSRESGCNARTHGWVPGLEGLDDSEKLLYENTCYTDGSCYQTARPAPAIASFGCMDMKLRTDETEFQDTASKVCTNMTSGSHASVWICCAQGNFCANQTLMYLPPAPAEWSSGWLFPAFLIFCFFFAAVTITAVIRKKSWNSKWKWYMRFIGNESSEGVHNADSSRVTSTSAFERATMSTTDGYYPENMPPNALRMLLLLEEESNDLNEGPGLTEKTIGNQVTRLKVIGRGGFGVVHWGVLKGENVAVKVFPASGYTAFEKEIEIFDVGMLRHPNVLRYIGSDKIYGRNGAELLLVTEFHANGSLHDFLGKNVIDLMTCYNMMRSAASGLAFLHSSVAGKSAKPAIAHRDIKSRNILVKSDLSCCIGDLGLSFSHMNTAERVEFPPSPTNGTARYKAPEILSQTLQAEVFESYLMADIYPFALVMWETLCRCEHAEITATEPEKVIPYVEYSQRDPDDKDMKTIVCDRKLRPSENMLWRKYPELNYILDIITTCWTANPTARYSALQIRMRLEKKQTALSMNGSAGSGNAMVAWSDFKSIRGVSGQPVRDFEMVPMGPPPSLVTQRVHDQATVENRNGQYKGKDEMKDPLIS